MQYCNIHKCTNVFSCSINNRAIWIYQYHRLLQYISHTNSIVCVDHTEYFLRHRQNRSKASTICLQLCIFSAHLFIKIELCSAAHGAIYKHVSWYRNTRERQYIDYISPSTSIKDNYHRPSVSFIQRFHCILYMYSVYKELPVVFIIGGIQSM